MYQTDLELLQTDFYSFYLYICENIRGADNVKTGEFEEDLCDFFEYEWYYNYLELKSPLALIEAPVQHGKSNKLRIFTSWLLGREARTYFNFYTADDKLRNQTEDMISSIMNSKEYRAVFNDIFVKTVNNGMALKNGNTLDFRLMGEGNTGYPSNVSIIDDPYRNKEDANSPTIREKVEQRFRGDIMSRRQERNGTIILHSRWHKQDLIGTIKSDEAIRNDKTITLLSKKYKAIDDNGKVLFPELRSHDFLISQKTLLGTYNFNALYQQEPMEAGGNVIKTEWFKTYQMLPKIKRYYVTGDTAFKTKESSDYSVFMLWGKDELKDDANFYIIDMIRGKWESPELLNNLQNAYEKWKKTYQISCLYIEDKASGIGLVQQLKRLKVPVHPVTPNKDKYARVTDVLPRIEAGYCWLPEIAEWKIDLITECEEFRADGLQAHDDIVDNISLGLSAEVNRFPALNWLY